MLIKVTILKNQQQSNLTNFKIKQNPNRWTKTLFLRKKKKKKDQNIIIIFYNFLNFCI